MKLFISLSGINNQKQNKMKTFRIEFQDNDQNELFVKVDEFVNIESAEVFAELLIATSDINDLSTFQITEL
jgi:hypothetical protein